MLVRSLWPLLREGGACTSKKTLISAHPFRAFSSCGVGNVHDDDSRPIVKRNDRLSHLAFLQWFQRRLLLSTPNDWYTLSHQSFIDHGGSQLLQIYHSPFNLLRQLRPELNLKAWLFQITPQNTENVKEFLEWLRIHVKHWTNVEDLYHLTQTDLTKNGGTALMRQYGSIHALLCAIYPEVKWLEWKLAYTPRGFWSIHSNQLNYLHWLYDSLGYRSSEDWYRLTSTILIEMHGKPLLRIYGGSPYLIISTHFPQYEWLPWKFSKVPAKFWDDSTNRKWFVEWFRKEQSIEAGEAGMEKWYQIVCHDMQLYGARTLLSRYNYSLSALLSSIYPGLPWKYERFKVLPKDSWRNIENVHGAIDHIAKSLDIRHLDDWYRVSLKQVKKLGFYHLFLMNGGLPSILASLYPDHDWVESKFKSSSKRSEQRLLWLKVQELFPGEKVIEEYRPIDLVAPGSTSPIEIDVFVPKYAIGFEYQGIHHFEDTAKFGVTSNVQKRDAEKQRLARNAGISLVPVPYWWDGSLAALKSAIKEQNLHFSQLDVS